MNVNFTIKPLKCVTYDTCTRTFHFLALSIPHIHTIVGFSSNLVLYYIRSSDVLSSGAIRISYMIQFKAKPKISQNRIM